MSTPENAVVTIVAADLVVIIAADQSIITSVSQNVVLACPSADVVSAASADELVIASVSSNDRRDGNRWVDLNVVVTGSAGSFDFRDRA